MFLRTSVATAVLAAALIQSGLVQGAEPATYDLLIRNGMIYDGSGAEPFTGEVGIKGDKIVYAGPATAATATKTVDANGLAVAPGFINMLSWATESLLVDGLGQSDLRRRGRTRRPPGDGVPRRAPTGARQGGDRRRLVGRPRPE